MSTLATPGPAPAFSFYAKDFLLSVMEMSLEIRGAYITLLAYQWDRGGVPGDPSGLARVLGCSAPKAARVWLAIRGKFVEGGGLYRNERLEVERRKQAHWRDTQRENGRKGGRPAAPVAETHGLTDGLAVGKPKPNRRQTLPCPLPISVSTGGVRTGDDVRAPAKMAFVGRRLRVSTWQHEDLANRLGSKAFDLLGWYPRLDAELEASGAPLPENDLAWLRAKFYDVAGLPKPNLFGRHEPAPKAYRDFTHYKAPAGEKGVLVHPLAPKTEAA